MAGVKITEHFAQRMKSTILRVEAMPLSSSGGSVPVRFDEPLTKISSGGGVVEAFYTGGWPKGTEKQITFLSNTASTALAVNLLRSVPLVTGGVPTARTCTVSVRSVIPAGTSAAYVLVNSEC